ncbi:MAG: patatin-like phospholipase family protein [bacterium]
MVKKSFFVLVFYFFCNQLFFAQNYYTLSLTPIEKNLPFGLTCLSTEETPKTALVLSGGGARGISQLGVLKALVENDIEFDLIVGTSMGSIIGGLYASGYSVEQLDSIIISARWKDFFALSETDRNDLFLDQKITEDKAIFALRLDGLRPIIPKAFNTGLKVSSFLNLLTLNAPLNSEKSFSDLLIPYRAVSTDLINGKKVVLDKGSLSQAMRASSSVSFLLEPVEIDSLLLVDGGLVGNVPVSVAVDLGSDFILAVNATSALRRREELTYPWEIADQIVSIPMNIIINQNLDAADYVITPQVGDKKNDDFTGIEGLIKTGYENTLSKVDSIKMLIRNKFYSRVKNQEVYFKNISFCENVSEIERELILKYSIRDSVSSNEILFDINNLINSGYYKDVDAEINIIGNRSELKINAIENPTVAFVQCTDANNQNLELDKKYFSALVGKPFNSKKTVNAAIHLLRDYRARGRSLAKIEKLNFDGTTRTLSVEISQGNIYNMFVKGNKLTDVSVITREFKFQEGDQFKIGDVKTGLHNLITTNLFEDVVLTLQRTDNQNNMTVNVIEKPSKVVRFGLRIDNENLTQASVDLREENLFGSGTEVGAIFSGGLRNRSFVFEHRANRIFDSYLTYKIRAFYEFNDVNVYTDDSTGNLNKFSRSKIAEYRQVFSGASLGMGTQVEKFGNIFVEGKFQSAQIINKSDVPAEMFENHDIASIKVGMSIDSQNKFPYPTSGFFINSYYETAQSAFGSDIGFTKFSFDYTSIFTLDTLHTMSTRFFVGFADETLPLSQQFSIGGQNSFFGLRDNEYRGRQVFLASLEYRFDIPFQMFFNSYFRVRYDLGSIWSERETIRFKDLRHGIGATLSWDTPIGPADFSVGKSFIIERSFPENIISWGPYYFYFTIGYYY